MTAPAADLAQLRDQIVARVYAMPEPELRHAAERLATAYGQLVPDDELHDWEREYLAEAPAGAYVIRYPEAHMKLSTDPVAMPPYGAMESKASLLSDIKEAEEAIDRGEGIDAFELLRELRSQIMSPNQLA